MGPRALTLEFNLHSQSGRLGFPASSNFRDVRNLMFAELSCLLEFRT